MTNLLRESLRAKNWSSNFSFELIFLLFVSFHHFFFNKIRRKSLKIPHFKRRHGTNTWKLTTPFPKSTQRTIKKTQSQALKTPIDQDRTADRAHYFGWLKTLYAELPGTITITITEAFGGFDGGLIRRCCGQIEHGASQTVSGDANWRIGHSICWKIAKDTFQGWQSVGPVLFARESCRAVALLVLLRTWSSAWWRRFETAGFSIVCKLWRWFNKL